jgi:hypothetical protein
VEKEMEDYEPDQKRQRVVVNHEDERRYREFSKKTQKIT